MPPQCLRHHARLQWRALAGEAIESIRSQTYADFEFIIVNDGSQDSSGTIIKAHAERDDRIQRHLS